VKGSLAAEVRAIIGEQTQREFAKQEGLSPAILSQILRGYIPGMDSKTAQALVLKHPRLVRFLLPGKIVAAILRSDEQQRQTPPAGD